MLKNHHLRFPPLNQPRIYAELSKMRVTTQLSRQAIVFGK